MATFIHRVGEGLSEAAPEDDDKEAIITSFMICPLPTVKEKLIYDDSDPAIDISGELWHGGDVCHKKRSGLKP
jgi:hypothetical protein